MKELKDIGLTRNSDLVESGIDEFADILKKKKSAKKPIKKAKKK